MPTVTPTILSNGQPMDPSYRLLSIDVRREVNRLPQAELRLIDGSAAKQQFAVSDSGFFDPGASVEIKLRYEGGADASVFKGTVTRQGIEANGDDSLLVVVAKDAAVKLAGTRRSACFEQKTDDAIIRQLVTDAGLQVGKLSTTKPTHPAMVQYYCADWDFIISRADAQGMLVVVEDGSVSLQPMAVSGGPRHHFEYGISEILDLELEADAGSQYGAVESVAWSLKDQTPTQASKANSVGGSPGDLDGAKLGKAVGNDVCALCHPVPALPDELQAWADATMARSRLALCRGRIAVPGFADVHLLDVMEIAGIGKRFDGTALLTGLRHRVDASGWRTDVQFGLPPEKFSQNHDIVDAPSAGLLPAVSGLQIGVVADFASDPDNELRVKVILPAVDPSKGTVWARLAAPDAGKDRGYYFRPEPKDEVVIGFLNNDPRYPVILGSLFGSKNSPAAAMGTPSDKNEQKGIVTKKGTTIGFLDGAKPSVFIETASKNKLLLDDDAKQVSLTDQHGNSITLSKDGIVLKSAKDLKIDASGNVEIKGSAVDVK